MNDGFRDEVEMDPLTCSNRFRRRMALGSFVALLALGGPDEALADGAKDDPHAQCHMSKSASERTTASYKVPDVGLVRADGVKVSLRREIDDGKPVILNFIYTTCTAICPLMSQTLAQVQSQLGDDRNKVRMISVSIDPEQDTPARLTQYAERFNAGPQWTFYTGTVEASVSTQKAFDVYRGDKMNHVPITFLRAAPGKPWVRLEGFANADDVVREYRQLLAAK